MEIGSFIEIEFPFGREYYTGAGVTRLNTGRAGILYALSILNCNTIWLPYYQCDSVRDFLKRYGIMIHFYHINRMFEPTDLCPGLTDAVLLVNYYGIMSDHRMARLARQYRNVIIDNAQAFFAKPIRDCLSVYSPRKFIGVPDGAYVLGAATKTYENEYPQDFSSDTAQFLLMRIEYGCEGKAYSKRAENEKRIDNSGIMKMSRLTHTILDGADYKNIILKRRENFRIANELFNVINILSVEDYCDKLCVPMVYPLLVEDDTLLSRLLAAKHFQGHWWSYLTEEMPKNSMEYWLSRYLVPITIDQRYGKDELLALRDIVFPAKH